MLTFKIRSRCQLAELLFLWVLAKTQNDFQSAKNEVFESSGRYYKRATIVTYDRNNTGLRRVC